MSSSFEDRLATAELCLDDLYSQSSKRKTVVAKLALKIFDAIIKNPDNPKFKRINSKKIQQLCAKKSNNDIYVYSLLESILRASGFEDSEKSFITLSNENIELMTTVSALLRERHFEEEEKEKKLMEEAMKRNRELILQNTKSLRKKKEKANKFKKNIIDKQQKENQDNIKNRVYVSSKDKMANNKFGRTDVKIEFKSSGGG